MPVLTTIRQSPAYLYLKTYFLCSLVTLLKAAPVSSRLPRIGETLRLDNYRIIQTRLGPRIVPVDRHDHPHGSPARPDLGKAANIVSSVSSVTSHLVISGELIGHWATQSRPRIILRRWIQRAVDLAQIKRLLRRDDQDIRTYPELSWDATVRRSSSIHPMEKRFIELRQRRISSYGEDSLRVLLKLPKGEKVDPRDVPLISLGGSGGGYRAMYGFAAFMSASKKLGLWDCVTWVAGVSGSCWTLAAYYTIGCHDVPRLMRHYLSMAKELAHPMSVFALNIVARSSRGVYFLIGPLVRKVRSGIIGLGIMDLYATLTTTYQFLPREPRTRLSRATFQLSKIWARSGINKGAEPMPILTAVRRAPQDSAGVRAHRDSSMSKGQPPERALEQHQTKVPDMIAMRQKPHRMAPNPARLHNGTSTDPFDNSVSKGFFQWFEISPLEVGSPDVHGYIPTWSWGRSFVSGRSIGRSPEQSLSLMLGQCTSAPAGPLTGYVSALLASLPRGTVMSRLLLLLNNFLRMRRWGHLWGNPIRAGHDPNPFYGLNTGPPNFLVNEESAMPDILGIGMSTLHPSRLDRPRLNKNTQQSDGQRLNRLARRILCKREWNELKILFDQGGSKQRWQIMKEYLSVAWVAKVAAHRALHPLHSPSWKDLAVSSMGHSYSTHIPDDKPELAFSEEWVSKNRGCKAPKLYLRVSLEGASIVANVLAAQDGPQTPVAQHAPLPINDKRAASTLTWEFQGRIRLMDSGMSNNLPNHVLIRPERNTDVIIAFDASSDVQTGSAIQRIQNFASDCHLELEDRTALFRPPDARFSACSDGTEPAGMKLESKFLDQYARVFRGRRENGQEVYLVYCPLLPNGINPEYDPAAASYSNSYNLVWSPGQIKTLFTTSEANVSHYAIETIKQVVLKVYLEKKARRLASSLGLHNIDASRQ